MPSAPCYKKAIREIYALDRFGSRPGLERISRLLAILGEPQRGYRTILVAGSNGKGSVTEMLGSILKHEGWRVGTYFSPQVEEFSERMRINGKNASKKEIADAYFAVKSAALRGRIRATFFEAVTAMALLIFAKRKVDFAVLEAGLGGRLDATNSTEPELSAIVSVCLEHTDLLGGTLAKIAREKCGIARRGRPLVCGSLMGAAKDAVEEECRRKGARAVFASEEVAIRNEKIKGGRHSFSASFRGKNYRVSLSAPGSFQVANARVAIAAAHMLRAGRRSIESGLSAAAPKYRFQEISRRPLTIADCAHNPGAAAALAAEASALPRPRVLLFSAMKDKDYALVLRMLAKESDKIIVTGVSLSRGEKTAALLSAAKKCHSSARAINGAKKALSFAKKAAGNRGCVLIAGSIYLLAELFGRDKIRIAQ